MATKIDVTHVGSLPRGEELTALLLAKDHGKPYDAADFDRVVQAAVDEAVTKQVAAGVTIVSDGELGKVGYSTYVTERLSGFGGNVERKPALDLAPHPALVKKLAGIMGRQEFVRAACIGEVRLKTLEPAQDDIRRFRQIESKAPGHPEYHWVSGVETTTGPLGQGVATSVGMAIAEKWLADRYNRPGFAIFDYDIYAVCGDGCLMEGVGSEAASLAGHLGLDNLCWIYDNNHITIEGSTSLAFTEDVATRFLGYGWNILRVGDANDLDRIQQALDVFRKTEGRPTLIILDSHIGPAGKQPQICSYHKLRHRHSGRYHWVDFHIMVPADWSIDKGHQVASSIEYEIENALGEGNATAHVEPCVDQQCGTCGRGEKPEARSQ